MKSGTLIPGNIKYDREFQLEVHFLRNKFVHVLYSYTYVATPVSVSDIIAFIRKISVILLNLTYSQKTMIHTYKLFVPVSFIFFA